MSYFTAGTENGAKERSMRIRIVAAARGGRGGDGRCGVLELVVQHGRGTGAPSAPRVRRGPVPR